MKAWPLLLALCAVADAKPMRIRQPPPIETNCRVSASWGEAKACIEKWEKGAVVSTWSPEVSEVTAGARHYLFVRLAGTWQLVYQPGDGRYELAGTSAMLVGKARAMRIDLGHHMQIGTSEVFMERVTLVCTTEPASCTALVTACTVISRGRATETFRGDVKATVSGLTVVGDRTYVGPICKDR